MTHIPTGTIDEQVGQVTKQFLQESAASIMIAGAAPSPVVYMFTDDMFTGWIGCRPHGPGRDLVNAVAGMGWTAAARSADRLLVGWEDHDMRTQLRGPDQYVRALHVADIPISGEHTVSWWPFLLTANPEGSATATKLQWVPEATGVMAGLELPPPVEELTAIWQANQGRLDVETTLATAQENDYRLSLL